MDGQKEVIVNMVQLHQLLVLTLASIYIGIAVFVDIINRARPVGPDRALSFLLNASQTIKPETGWD